MFVATYMLCIVYIVKEVTSFRFFFVMYQSINLFRYFIILPLLMVQGQGFPRKHDPRPP